MLDFGRWYTFCMESKEKSSAADFIKYNNAVPIVLGLLFFSTSATFAATPAVRDSFYKAESQVASVDNRYLLAVDLDSYAFSMKVTEIRQDDEYFYLTYDFKTIDVVDAVWQGTTRQSVLRISKALLRGGDLETYAESELSQVRSQEISRLNETQKREKSKGSTEKVVATVYTGIIGKMVRPTQEIVPGYESIGADENPLAIKDPEPLLTWDANAEKTLQAPTSAKRVVGHSTSIIIIGDEGTSSPSGEGGEQPPAEDPQTDPNTDPVNETPPAAEPTTVPQNDPAPEEPASETPTP